MKNKIFYGILLILCVFLVVGCSKDKDDEKDKKDLKESKTIETLECSYSETEEGVSMDMTMSFDYDNNQKKFLNGNTKLKITLPDEYVDLFKDYDSSKLCESFGSELGGNVKNCNANISGNIIDMSSDIDINKLYTEGSEEDKNMTIDEVKKELEQEQEGVTCTIK